LFSTFETVAVETPEAFATSRIVTLMVSGTQPAERSNDFRTRVRHTVE
jgi:hypothetical protein